MKLTIKTKTPYAEEGQPNPLRWLILSGTPETGFVNESAWLRCKDFFNDYAVAYNGGPRFGIYGFSTEVMNIPKKGEPVFMALNGTTKEFLHNLLALNDWLYTKQKCPLVTYYKTDKADSIIEIPGYYFQNTYTISLLSLIIRLINHETKFKSFDDVLVYKGFPDKDQQKWNQVIAKDVFFALPEKFKKYTWYAGENYNSETKDLPVYQLSGLVHNGGVLSYGKFF